MKTNQPRSLHFNHEKFLQLPAVGIVRGIPLEQFKRILPAYVAAGFTTIEVTMNTKDFETMMAHAHDSYYDRLNIGAGTVCNKEDLEIALRAGAQFIVTPIVAEEVIRVCVESNMPVFPGALSPTEIYKAWQLGASMVKLYPATSMGPAYIRDVKAPLPAIRLMPTGGIHAGNIKEYFMAGADAVGLGNALFDTRLFDLHDQSSFEKHFTGLARLVSQSISASK